MKKISIKERGFTLIELLIVIAILGVLTTVLLVTINPLEQLARGRDAGRRQVVKQLSKAVTAYYTTQGVYPTQNNTWITTLVTSGDVSAVPSPINFSLPIQGNTACDQLSNLSAQNNYCYGFFSDQPTQPVILTRLESGAENYKCHVYGTGTNHIALFMWSSYFNRTSVICVIGGINGNNPGGWPELGF